MSLNSAQIAATRRELTAALSRSGLAYEDIADALGISTHATRAAVGLIEPVNSVDVWAVRDLLEHALHRAQRESMTFSALTEAIRPQARLWFPLRDIPASLVNDLIDPGPQPA